MLHVDMDQFIAAVEMLRHPELAGLPVMVGGGGDPTERGVVPTASYEAREFGVRSGMPLRTAVRRCPQAVVLPVDNSAYEEASAVVMDRCCARCGVIVEVIGWDEAFVGAEADDPEAVARRIQAAVLEQTALHCSIGIGDNKRAGQDRHRVRQARRGVPVDRRELGRGDVRPSHPSVVGHRRQDVTQARGARLPAGP